MIPPRGCARAHLAALLSSAPGVTTSAIDHGPARHAAAIVLILAASLGLSSSLLNSAPLTAPARAFTLPDGRIDINSATAAQLRSLPGVGPAISERIVDDREVNGPFNSVADLQRVRGIGPRTVQRIADHAIALPR